MSKPADMMRISELCARVGVSAHALRAWERRYGLLTPQRSAAGYRVYGAGDEARIRDVLALTSAGVPISAAVARVLGQERASPAGRSDSSDSGPSACAGSASGEGDPDLLEGRAFVHDFVRAISAFDEAKAHAALDRLVASLSLPQVIDSGLMPALMLIGEKWENQDLTVAHEHLASHIIRTRLGAFTSTAANNAGPLAVLACLPGEQHDLALLCLGALLTRSGWRITFLGADTPVADTRVIADRLGPACVVLSSHNPRISRAAVPEITLLARRHETWIGGRGTQAFVPPPGLSVLTGSVGDACRQLTASLRPPVTPEPTAELMPEPSPAGPSAVGP